MIVFGSSSGASCWLLLPPWRVFNNPPD
jgi:hypothetical protein